jgi:phage regulator Rha-like protein
VRKKPVPAGPIERRIVVFRGQKVMLSPDLAQLYGVKPKALVQAVKRNIRRFPDDFMFQLNWNEVALMRSRSVTLNKRSAPAGSRSQVVTLKRGQNVKYAPYAFTEQGVAMLSSVLRSERAVQVNIEIMRAFVRLRAMAYSYKELANKIHALEQKYDAQFKEVFDAIRALMEPPPPPSPSPKHRIGFRPGRNDEG